MSEIEVAVERIEGGAQVAISGVLDSGSVLRLHDRLEQLRAEGIDRVILDLRQTKYAGSSGLGSLVRVADTFDPGDGRRQVIFGVQPNVMVVFRMLLLDQFFLVVDTEQQARDTLAGRT